MVSGFLPSTKYRIMQDKQTLCYVAFVSKIHCRFKFLWKHYQLGFHTGTLYAISKEKLFSTVTLKCIELILLLFIKH